MALKLRKWDRAERLKTEEDRALYCLGAETRGFRLYG